MAIIIPIEDLTGINHLGLSPKTMVLYRPYVVFTLEEKFLMMVMKKVDIIQNLDV